MISQFRYSLRPSVLFLFAFSLILHGCDGIPDDVQCIPVAFATERGKTVSYEVKSYREEASFTQVVDFFDQQLDPVSIFQDAEPGEWQAEIIDDSQILYSCSAAINSLEGELGCIYVREEMDHTLIETVWYLSGGSGPWCEPDLSVVR